MNQAALARRSRTLTAMGLGPLWRLRTPAVPDVVPVVRPTDQAPSRERTARIALLERDALRDAVVGCVACGLAASRTQAVFGGGATRPEWLVVGEAPDANEDLQGEPSVGPAGQLLDAMLAAVGRSRERDVFVLNIVRCRPPGDRDPLDVELDACRPFLERQIALLGPKLILVVGDAATAALLGPGGSSDSEPGRVHRVWIGGRETPVIATRHPAHLLRSPEEKARAWQDLCLARDTYERLVIAHT